MLACAWHAAAGTCRSPLLKHCWESMSISRKGRHRADRRGSRPSLLCKITRSQDCASSTKPKITLIVQERSRPRPAVSVRKTECHPRADIASAPADASRGSQQGRVCTACQPHLERQTPSAQLFGPAGGAYTLLPALQCAAHICLPTTSPLARLPALSKLRSTCRGLNRTTLMHARTTHVKRS